MTLWRVCPTKCARLAGKVDRASPSGDDGVLNALEERIGALADALAARNQGGQRVPHELEAVITGLVDKIERMQLTRGDHTALGQLEDRIAKLVEKLDASDARVNQLEAIERGLAELLIHIEHQRVRILRAPRAPAWRSTRYRGISRTSGIRRR